MRALTIAAMLISAVALAQPVPGTWTGYVNGWVPDSRPSTPLFFDSTTLPRRTPRISEQERRAVVYSQLLAQQAFFTQQTLAAQVKDQERQREADALAAQQRLVEQQQALIQQQQAAQAQLLAEQQQLAAERERLRVEQERQALETERAKLAEVRSRALEEERAAKEREVAAREAARLAQARADDGKPGPQIHRWVDADGVVHYSTRPPR